MSDLILAGILMHLFVDWFFQNEWISNHKTSLLHPASYFHSFTHFIGMCFIFPYEHALLIALLHLLIDTRKPLQFWRWLIKQTRDPANPASIHVAFWQDQVAHILVIALVVLLGPH